MGVGDGGGRWEWAMEVARGSGQRRNGEQQERRRPSQSLTRTRVLHRENSLPSCSSRCSYPPSLLHSFSAAAARLLSLMAPVPPSSTTEVRAGHVFDVAALERFMAAHVAPFAADRSNRLVVVRQFEGGQSNPTFYLCDALDNEYVLRKQPPGKLLPSAHAVDREYRIMAALAGSGVPVPEVLALCTEAAVLGGLFYIMRFLRGLVYRDVLLPGLSPDRRARIYDSMNRALAAIHCTMANDHTPACAHSS